MEQQNSEDSTAPQTVRCSDFALKASNPSKLFALYSSLGDLNATKLQQKVNRYIEDETSVKHAFFIFLDQTSQDGIIQVISDKELDKDFRFVVTETAFKQCIFTSQSAEVDPTQLGPDLLRVVCTAGVVDNLYCVPVHHPVRGLVLLYCLGGYSPGLEYNYSLYVTECLRHCLGTILNTLAYEEQKRLHLRCYSLLKGARNLITHLGDVTDLLREIMTEARKLTNAERCSLFLLDEQGDLESKVFDGFKAGEPVTEVKIKSGQGIAGHVAQSGVLVNIRDAYNHPLFYREVDKHTGFRTRNILCFPIVDESRVIGVAELVNKVDGTHFDQFDEEVAMAFSVYCGISIMHSLVYKKVQDAQARSKLSNELMMYYMKVSDEDVQRVLDCKVPHDLPNFTDFNFNPRNIPISETPCLCLKMFEDMGFIKHFNIPVHTLLRFILYAQRGYRDTPYHNWSHAFAVLHFAFIVMKNCRIMERKHLTPLEGLALLVSAMCHDIDHRGTTNQFQLRSGNSLARLYSSEGSVMERHHVSQTMCILNTEGCNIVAHLDETLFKQFIDLISEMILATDMVVHFKMLPEEKQMSVSGFDESRDRHRELLRGLIISCADISDQTKDWTMCRRVAKLIYDEFFTQGDMEKAMGVDPMDMMDRDKAKIPDLQVEFLSHVVSPVYDVLVSLYPEAKACQEQIRLNLECWQKAIPYFQDQTRSGKSAIEILSDSGLDDILHSTEE
ncbi:cGMP-dependent 3',5'-cyclic phosphodiesterase-like [Macrosteles quadrilineatus]|uniref:cGMP-dependent 3',5'-cyclic phosphodiesterase-like n=1 Tax=Macrosteles quadrilineatus TaxID=74068 RepID=UPI0023E239C3|nr:cGMP-dependent 3',5'-cyclic phosphodiesterase-like [Macrosteles quadrilineatus]